MTPGGRREVGAAKRGIALPGFPGGCAFHVPCAQPSGSTVVPHAIGPWVYRLPPSDRRGLQAAGEGSTGPENGAGGFSRELVRRANLTVSGRSSGGQLHDSTGGRLWNFYLQLSP